MVGWRPNGPPAHRLRDLTARERIYELRDPARPTDFLPLRSLDGLPNNLPLQVASFVGRECELAEVKRLLGSVRLLTLTGAGGAGKTRLALQTAADLIDAFADGAWFVDLAAVTDASLVASTALAALGVGETPGQDPASTLVEYVRRREVLLILDNCEHLLESCAQLVSSVIRGCPDTRVLVTVFGGGWALEAAEVVGQGQPVEANEVLDLLTSLVDKSLLVADVRGSEERYDLETIRQYAEDRLLHALCVCCTSSRRWQRS